MNRKKPIEYAIVYFQGDSSVGIHSQSFELKLHILPDVEESELKEIKEKIKDLYELIEGETPSWVMFDCEIESENEADNRAFDELQKGLEEEYFKEGYMRHSKVCCNKCGQRFNSDEVKFLNIESDIMERDVMTFECPICKTEQKSHVYIK